MANIKSKVKRMKQSRIAAARNKEIRSLIKSRLRKFKEAVAAKNLQSAQVVGTDTMRILDKAAAKNIIHRNRAAEKKSLIAAALNKLQVSGKKEEAKTKKTPAATTKKASSKS